MNISMTNKKGVRLLTNGCFCEENIEVVPALESLEVTENGTFAPSDGKVGFDSVTVNVESGSDMEKYFEARHSKVVLPNATSIKPNAFYGDIVLKNIEMPKVTSIGDYAFQNCSQLSLTSLPSGLTSIGLGAFMLCKNLVSLTFEGKLNSIATNAFYNCSNLLTINVPWAEGEVSGAPWGATSATINYNYTGE